MAGLLDGIFNDPQTMGLLSAAAAMAERSGPSTRPTSFGQVMSSGLLGGMQGYGITRKANLEDEKFKLDQEKEKMQMDLLKQQVAQATRKNGLMNDMLQQYMGVGSTFGAGQDALAAGAKVGDIGPTVSNAARMPAVSAASNPLLGIPREALAHDLAFNDGKNVSEWMFKRGTPDMQVSNGYAYDKNKLPAGFLPQFNVSQDGKSSLTTIGQDGLPTVSAPRGAVDTFSAYQNAGKQADTANEIVTVDLPSGPRQMTKQQAVALSSGRAPGEWGGINATTRAAQPQRENERLSILQTELANERDPANRAALTREIQRMGGQDSSIPGIALANKDRTAVTTKIASERLSTLEKDAQSQQNILSKLNIAERLINEGTFGNDLKSKLGMLGQNTGLYQTPQGVNTNLLTQIGNDLVLARGSLGAGVSTADAERYDRAAGDFANAQSNEQRRKAISIMKEIAGTAFSSANTARNQYAETGSLPDYSAPKASDAKTYRDFGYNSPQEALKDARNALLRYPNQKAEIVRRLEAAGITQHGIK